MGPRRNHCSQPGNRPARRGSVGRSFRSSEPSTPRDLALPNVAILEQLVARVVEAGNDQSWGDVVTILATTALRISEVSGLRVGDIDLVRGMIHVLRQIYPGRGGLVTKETKGRRRRTVPIIDPLRPTLVRLTAGRRAEERLVLGPRGGVITTATCGTRLVGTRWSPSSGSLAWSATAYGTPP